MELKDTVVMMESSDYQDRYKAEYYQLKVRVEKLTAMLEKYATGTLSFTPSCSYEVLFEQLVYMRGYMRILKERAKVEGVAL
ncbi:crAss001_48 related protein [uncultured Selenomonas sp.]|uniref:crAss001_48 related protein n=1 Tax=uncultured Selenomonas sp. TaxID=159275 RepID=UPI0028E6FCBC|nr:hypothetical protein [uncultured Selenomonas sp.]